MYSFCQIQFIWGFQTVDISNILSAFVPIRPILRDATVFNSVVQLLPVSTSPDTVFAQIEYPHSDSDSNSSSHDLMDFHVSSPMDEEFVDTSADGTAPDPTQISLPPPVNHLSLPIATNLSTSFVELRASISRLVANQTRDSRKLGDSDGEVMSKINHLERALLDSLAAQDQAFRGLIKNSRQEAHNDTDVLSLALKVVRAQNAILSTDLADVRKEVKDQKELFKEMDEWLATVRSEFLDFHAQAQENHLNLSTQLVFLVDYINRGGDAKKGEGCSSRRQPPTDDQNRPCGGSASRGSGSGGSSRRDDRRDSSKKRRSSSGGGGSGTGGESYGPYGSYKRDAEWWLYGKNPL
ncbi:golgin subfamily B member 1-like [Dorcoceras hygrometricum]|uniref:Golgin subfamily B member 1-like n=1 Tax=Dorcoceras hygrometricum TaxID=472368 RepID=A0A2Z7AMI9_9LAMI|nr:golgin subfamily B member 1-like [Dorcoceras hygrometricum]